MMTRKLIFLLSLAFLFACKAPTPPIKPPINPVALTSDPSVSVGIPVSTARTWASGIAPNKAGSWNFITEVWELYSPNLPEWVVVDIATGATHIFEGPKGVYAHEETKATNQIRASNGRLFFPESSNYITYYDPVDEAMHQLPRIVDPVNDILNKQGQYVPGDNIIYKMVFGPDGLLYGTTQSDFRPDAGGPYVPMVFVLDPITLQIRILGHVGTPSVRLSYSYGYSIRVDPPWIYVAVGETPWELAALNITTGEMRILAMLSDNSPWITVSVDTHAVIATFTTNVGTPEAVNEMHYLADGQMWPYVAKQTTFPFPTRNVTPYSNPVVKPPQVDDSYGVGTVLTRPFGSTGAWSTVNYTANNLVPVDIASIATLPDGTLIGDTLQYNGHWRYTPSLNKSVWYTAVSGILSQTISVVLDDRFYETGYPNGGLFALDWTQPWLATRTAAGATKQINPLKVGEFYTLSRSKYARFIIANTTNHRVYSLGHRERDGHGATMGYYDATTKTFGGTFDGLNFMEPRGLVDVSQKIVMSGVLSDDPAFPGQTPPEAQLVIYDYNLTETARQIVKPGLIDTGELFKTSDTTFMGISSKAKAAYLYDLPTATVTKWVDLGVDPGDLTQRSDGSVWGMFGSTLTRIDPVTLDRTSMALLAGAPANMTWLGSDLYFSVGPELRVIHGL